MILPTIATENTLVADADLSAAISDFGWINTAEILAIDSILHTSMVVYWSNNAQTDFELSYECEAFKQDAIISEVASVSCAYDPVLFCNFFNDIIALSIFYSCWKHDS